MSGNFTDLTLTGNVKSNLIPDSIEPDKNLGSLNFKWRELYTSNISDHGNQIFITNLQGYVSTSSLAEFSNSIIPSGVGTQDLGSSSNRWQQIFSSNISDIGSSITITNLNQSAIDFTNINTHVEPSDINKNLGSDSKPWKKFYSSNIIDDGTVVTINGLDNSFVNFTSVPSDILPSTSLSYNLGNIDYRFGDLWTDNITDTGGNVIIENLDLNYLAFQAMPKSIVPLETTLDLGGDSNRWYSLYTTNITDDGTNVVIEAPSGSVTINNLNQASVLFAQVAQNISPLSNLQYNLGGPNNEFSTFYSRHISDTTNGLTFSANPDVLADQFILKSSGSGKSGIVFRNEANLQGANDYIQFAVTDTSNVELSNYGAINQISFVPKDSSSANLGLSTRRWERFYSTNISDDSNNVTITGSTITLNSTTSAIINNLDLSSIGLESTNSNIYPNGQRNLGHTNNKWYSFYSTNISDNGTSVTLSNIQEHSLRPDTNNGGSVGTSSVRYGQLYTRDLHAYGDNTVGGVNVGICDQTDSLRSIKIGNHSTNHTLQVTANSVFTGNVSITGDASFQSNLISNSLADLGNTTDRWDILYNRATIMDSTGVTYVQPFSLVDNYGNNALRYRVNGLTGTWGFFIGTHLFPNTHLTNGIGNTNLRWKEGWIEDFSIETWLTWSDVNLKQDINLNTTGMDFINDLTTKTFRYKPSLYDKKTLNSEGEFEICEICTEPSKIRYGIIAQEVETVLINHGIDINDTKFISTNENGDKMFTYTELIPILIKALQEEDAKHVALEARVTALENV